jgi:Na+/H+ antiporter NhaD/arsenite permease-like protein
MLLVVFTRWIGSRLTLTFWLGSSRLSYSVVRLKRVPEGKSVNRIRLLIGTLTVFGLTFLAMSQHNSISVVVMLLAFVGMGCMMVMDYYD